MLSVSSNNAQEIQTVGAVVVDWRWRWSVGYTCTTTRRRKPRRCDGQRVQAMLTNSADRRVYRPSVPPRCAVSSAPAVSSEKENSRLWRQPASERAYLWRHFCRVRFVGCMLTWHEQSGRTDGRRYSGRRGAVRWGASSVVSRRCMHARTGASGECGAVPPGTGHRLCVCVCGRCSSVAPWRSPHAHTPWDERQAERERRWGTEGEDNDERLKHGAGRVLLLLLVGVLATLAALLAASQTRPRTLQPTSTNIRWTQRLQHYINRLLLPTTGTFYVSLMINAVKVVCMYIGMIIDRTVTVIRDNLVTRLTSATLRTVLQ